MTGSVRQYRAPMRSRLDDVPPYAGVARALGLGVCGVGGRLATTPADLAEALVATQRTHGERVARRLARFAAVPDGSFAWTLDEDWAVYRGVLAGSWTYDASDPAYQADLVHVRPCAWEPVALRDVPGAVLQTFARGGRNFQRISALR